MSVMTKTHPDRDHEVPLARAVERSMVRESLAGLYEDIATLTETAAELERRLAPVLRDEKDQAAALTRMPASGSGLVDGIHAARVELWNLAKVIDGIGRRVGRAE